MKSFSITDVGLKRTMNQDYIYCNENSVGTFLNLFIVADGMGGHNAGDFASRFCVEHFVDMVRNGKECTPVLQIETALNETNEVLLRKAQEQSEMEGMGTTFVVATIVQDSMIVANIGDSRLYLINHEIKQITEDHSLVEEMVRNGELNKEEAKYHPKKNVITRALGANLNILADYFEVPVKKGDKILLCSDGLSNMVEDSEIKNIIEATPNDIESTVKHLVDVANENGGKDNISIILIEI